MEEDDFIEKFHNLKGILLKEKKKALFQLLESHKSLISNENILQNINKKLIPKTYLEETYKLEFLLYFQRSTEVLELLKTGDDKAVNKIIRKSWFQKSLTDSLKNGDFLRNVFPQLSVRVRIKILRQIIKQIKNEETVDDQFDKLLELYGIKTALIILSACSSDKIKKILLDWGVILPKSELKLLHDKNPSLINFYYDEYYRRGGNMNHLKDFSKYLSHKDPNRFVDLLLKYKFDSYKLGRRTTEKYVSENKEVILSDPQLYLRMGIFQRHSLVKQLGDDFPAFLKLTFPKYLPDLMNSEVFDLLNFYQKRKRYAIYRETFENVYKKNLLEHEEFITEDLLQVIQDDMEKEKWIEEKLENRINYIKYKRSSLAVPELKEKLIKSDNVERQKQLLESIVTSSGLSGDYEALLDILKFFCSRFKKSDDSFFSAFLDSIHAQFKLEKLSEHWKYIHELILIQYKKNMSINGTIVFEYCKYLYKNGNKFDELIPIYLKTGLEIKFLKFKNETFRDERFEKQFLALVLEYHCLEKFKDDMINSIVSAVKKWNKKHPGNLMLVSSNEYIVKSVKKSVNLHWIYTPGEDFSSMKYLVCRENMVDEFADAYFNPVNSLEGVTITKWFLKYQPNIFHSKIDKVIRLVKASDTRYLIHFLKKYEHIGLVHAIIEYYIQKLEDRKEKKKSEIAQLLASIMPSRDYLSLMKKYTPSNDKLNEISGKKNLHRIKTSLTTSLRFSKYHLNSLLVLSNYCTDDYFLKHSLFSLYYCSNRTPEKSLQMVLDILLRKPNEIGKHAFIMAAIVFPIKTYEELSQKIIVTDKNCSLRKLIASFYYKYFVKNPHNIFFEILNICMSDLSSKEKRTLCSLANVHNVPVKYKSIFMRQISQIFDNLEEREKTSMHIYYNKLMNSVQDYDVKFLSTDLCVNIINKCLFVKQYKKNHACLKFATKFLMYGVNMKENIDHFMRLLKLYKEKHWNGRYGLNFRSVIHSICKFIFEKTVEREKMRFPVSKDFPTLFSQSWREVFSIQDTFEEYLMLDFMVIQYKCDKKFNSFAKEICRIYEGLIFKYGDIIITYFKNFILEYLKQLLGDNNYDSKCTKLLAEILKINDTLPVLLLVVQLLPHYQFDDEFIENFSYVMEKLQTDKVLQVHLNIYYKDKIDSSALTANEVIRSQMIGNNMLLSR